MIRALAKAGADINYTGLCREQKRPALHAAAETCPSDVVKTLLDMQPDLNARWDGETALHVAARREKQNKSVLEALLRAGCNTWARTTPEGLTARELAESAGNSKLAVVLVAAEAKAETDSEAGGQGGDVPGGTKPCAATPASMRDNPAADDASDQDDATLGSHLDSPLKKLQQQLTQQAAQLRGRCGECCSCFQISQYVHVLACLACPAWGECQGVDHLLLHMHLRLMCREGQVQELQGQLAEATAQPSHGTKAQLQHSLMAAQGQLARAQEGMLQLEAQQAGHAEQLADVTGQLAGVQVQLEAGRTGREAQQAQQQELLALREQLAVVQTERNAAAELQQQAASQIALLRSREVELGSLRRMVRELQGMQRGADELRAADEVRQKEHEGELQQVKDEARQLRAALAQSTATHSRLEAALQSDLAQARAELKEATAGRLAASTARSTADLKAQALQRELAAAAEMRRQLHSRLQHDAQQHIKRNASLEAGTCKLREDLIAAQQKVKQLERHVQRLTGIDPTQPRGCDQQALLTKAALDAALAAALHGTKVECSEIGHSSLDQHLWPSVT
eukprot:jgi/Astpho2/8067/Aster-03014